MEQAIEHFVHGLSGILLVGLIVVCLFVLGKGASVLVKEAVILSQRWGMPKTVVGATIISLGTTSPEAAVSVVAAIKGDPEIALGNAVGSIICDTGLILGLACIIRPLPLDRSIVNRQGWIQLIAGCLLVAACWNYSDPASVIKGGGNLPQVIGFLFGLLLVAYIWKSIKWAKEGESDGVGAEVKADETASSVAVLVMLLVGIVLVVGSSTVLVPTVTEAALRVNIPKSIIAATLVAFGTSLPELVTAVTATLKGHGELAIGNIIGADILNVLFVAGLSAAVTTNGLPAPAYFFAILFPAMLFILVVFRVGIFASKTHLQRPFGFILLAAYIVITVIQLCFIPGAE